MSGKLSYPIPACEHHSTLAVSNSRFITTISFAPTIDEVKAFRSRIRDEMPDASHHVYAFRVGYGNTVIEGMSDDREPSGTAGAPCLAVLRGHDIGDIIAVVTRYFGGTKLGTGGLVRAYTEAIRTALTTLPIKQKIAQQLVGVDTPYTFYDGVKRLIAEYAGVVNDEVFAADITLMVHVPIDNVQAFTQALRDVSAGQIESIIFP